jgi:stearoyl-CoA desaturase (Delta-9 desaturase)
VEQASILIYTLICTHLTMVSVCIYLHRGTAHKSMDFHPALAHFFRFWLWLTDGCNVKEWVATHRRHHRFTDIEGDPHSPVLLGIYIVAVRNFFETVVYRYRSFAPKLEVEVYGAGCPDDWLERNVYTKHQRLGLVLLLIINVLLFGKPGLLVWLIQICWTPLWSSSVITGFAHYWGGYKNPACNDNSRNFPGLGLFIIGDEYHSNHHARPGSAKLSHKWYEFDLGWLYITILKNIGLIHVR